MIQSYYNTEKERVLVKKITVAIAVIMIMVSVLGITAFAEERIGGSCGTNAKWSLDLNSGVLTISGSGMMSNYNFAGLDLVYTPWFNYRSNITSAVVEEGITSIGAYSFYNLRSLTKVTLPNSATSLGESAFAYCSSLESVTLPTRISFITKESFRNCSSLKEVTIPEDIITIQPYAFYACNNLTRVTFNSHHCGIVTGAFDGCNNLTFAGRVDSTVRAYAQANNIPFLDIETNEYIDLTKCGDNVHWSLDLTSGVLKISGSGRMYDYSYEPGANVPSPWNVNRTKITSVIIENGVTYIGKNAFYFASNMRSAVLPDSVTEIADHAFYNCISLQDINIPSTVKSIGESGFGYCDGLTNIVLPEGLTEISPYLFVDCDGLTSFTIPSTVTTLGEGAFAYCNKLENVYFPTSVKKIGLYAFARLEEVTTLHVPYGSYAEKYANSNRMKCVVNDAGVVKGISLTLNGSLGVRIYYDITYQTDIAFMVQMYNSETEELYDRGLNVTYDGTKKLYYTTVYILPKDADNICLTFKNAYNNVYYTFEAGYVSNIIDSMKELALNDPTSNFAKASELLTAIDEYTESVDRFFNSTQANVPPEKPVFDSISAPSRSGSVDGVEYLHATLVLKSTTTLRHYFKVSKVIPTFTLEGESLSPKLAQPGIIYVDIPNIPAHDLDRPYVLTVSDSMEISFSVLNYIQLALSSNDEKLCDLVTNMYNYWKATEEYRIK